MMDKLNLKGICKKFGDNLVVYHLDLSLKAGEFVSLLGPSGCGKTTTLRSVAGLERPSSGQIRVGDAALYDSRRGINVPARQRGLGMVFQSYAIWPHMTVFKNVSFPLEAVGRKRRSSAAEIREKVGKVLEATQLTDFADRPATNLSGGQQQRLALARALVVEPSLLLLDEPLSNLDAKLRESMRIELKRLQRDLGITSVYETHDQNEALVLSNRIAVMNAGEIMQIGTPREIYTKPANKFVADFIGNTNFVDGVVAGASGGMSQIDTPNGALWTTWETPATGTAVSISLRPECLGISRRSSDGTSPNEWEGIVVSRAYQGDHAEHIVRVGTSEVCARSDPGETIPPGTDVWLTIHPSHVTIIPQ
jgi:iron(III) transport system ATP-binding protein